MKRVGILGLPQSGKTTVFELLLEGAGGQATGASGREQVGVVRVPDERVDRLSAMYQPKKTTYAQIQFVDTVAASGASARSAAKGQDLFASVRNCDALMAVVRDFGSLEPPNPARDLQNVDAEFILNDLAIVENRMTKLEKELRIGKKQNEREHVMLTRLRALLEAEKPLRAERFDAEEDKLIRGFQMLTLKPLLVVVSQDDRSTGQLPTPGPASLALGLKAQVEREIASLPPEERPAFRAELGITEDGLSRVIRACYSLLGLVSFFTVGPDEVRAWTVHQGDKAVDAAGEIHTDLAKGFIRAEVIHCDQLLALGGHSQARDKGLLRLEGRDYTVQDGDCMEIRFNK